MKSNKGVLSYTKIEMEILKRPSEYRVCTFEDENTSYNAFTDGYIIYFIPQNSCHLNIEKFTKRENMEKFIAATLNTPRETAKLSNIYKKERVGVSRKLESTSTTVYVNEKYLKPFANCEFEIIDTIKPIIARWHWLIVGMIMPLKVNESERW